MSGETTPAKDAGLQIHDACTGINVSLHDAWHLHTGSPQTELHEAAKLLGKTSSAHIALHKHLDLLQQEKQGKAFQKLDDLSNVQHSLFSCSLSIKHRTCDAG